MDSNQGPRGATVVTSISGPSEILRRIANISDRLQYRFIMIGDVSSPANFSLEGCDYYDIPTQEKLDFRLSKLCPQKHYSRKNLGYLIAMSLGVQTLWETDDDNYPNEYFELKDSPHLRTQTTTERGWSNLYKRYSDEHIWPRGYPLEEIEQSHAPDVHEPQTSYCPVVQYLADDNPDVDAVYRFIGKLPIFFKRHQHPTSLAQGAWCPFNSQNTQWFPAAYPLLYLPSFCSFRMTDIWRSFITQRLLWTIDAELAFDNATVKQDRNEHNLLKDFECEVPGYLNNSAIIDSLESLSLKTGEEHLLDNLRRTYEALIRADWLPAKEIELVNAWIDDCQAIAQTHG